jgi:regulator of sigma E protease
LQTPSIDRATLKVKRGDKIIEVELTPYEDKTWPSDELGLILMPDQKKEKADNFIDAIRMGFRDTSRNMSQVFSNLRGMITGQISVENLGGPVTIARVAYRIAGVDIWEFIFFIGLISINLAVINFLPIPVLDGGHMVFQIYEKITGRPAPESFRIGATWLGLILILGLMVFVLYLDFSRIF